PTFPTRRSSDLYYSRYGLGLSLVAAVAYAAVRPVARYAPIPDLVEQAAAASMIPMIYGLLVGALYLLSRRLGASPRLAALAALGAVGGTFVLAYSKEFFSEPLTALCLTVSIEQAIAGYSVEAGFAAAGAGLTRPQAFAFAPFLLWSVWRQGGWPGLRRVSVPVALGVIAACGYNLARFGGPLEFGYEAEGFSTPVLKGTAGLLLDP